MKYFKHPLYALLLLIPVLGMSLFMMSAPAFASYTCGTTSNHCYAKVEEASANSTDSTVSPKYTFGNFTGMYTYDDVVQITESGDGYAQYNNEIWLIDDNLNWSTYHGCYASWDSVTHAYSNPETLCWMETGYQKLGSNYSHSGTEQWFASYTLPFDGASSTTPPYCDNNNPLTGSCGYLNLYGSQVSSGDYGLFGDMEISYVNDTPTTHQMAAIVDGGSGTGTSMSETINNVYLNPTETQIGTELGGTSGTSVPKTHFKHNQYAQGGSWYYQTLDGVLILIAGGSNLNGGWQTGGSYKPSNNTTGGIFDTCDQSGCAP